MVERQTQKRAAYRVNLELLDRDLVGTVMVIYDRRNKQVITFLPSDWTPEKAEAHRAEKKSARATWLEGATE